MKITVYTIKDCQFSKAEKEYLKMHNLAFEEKDLESDKNFLTEMLAVSNNFAGTPVTKIEKEDGAISVLKGFTKEEFDKTLGFEVAPVKSSADNKATEQVVPETAPKTETPIAPTIPPIAPTIPPVAPPADPMIGNVMNKLESTMNQPAQQPSIPQAPAAPAIPPVPEAPAPAAPSIPSIPSGNASAPSIPDFPTDIAAQPGK